MPLVVSSCARSKLSHGRFRSRSLYGIGFRGLPLASTPLYMKSWSGIGKPAAAHSCKTLLGTDARSVPRKKEQSKWLMVRMLAAKTCTCPSLRSYIFLIFLTNPFILGGRVLIIGLTPAVASLME